MKYKFFNAYISAYGCMYKYQIFLSHKGHLINLLYVYKVIYIYTQFTIGILCLLL